MTDSHVLHPFQVHLSPSPLQDGTAIELPPVRGRIPMGLDVILRVDIDLSVFTITVSAFDQCDQVPDVSTHVTLQYSPPFSPPIAL